MALTLDISSSTNQLLSGETATFTFTFSEELVLNETSAFTASDISAVTSEGESLGSFSDVTRDDTDPKIYTAKFTPTNNLIASGNVYIAFNSVRTVSGDGWQNRDALAPVSVVTKAIYSLTKPDGTSERISTPEGTGDASNSIQLKVSRTVIRGLQDRCSGMSLLMHPCQRTLPLQTPQTSQRRQHASPVVSSASQPTRRSRPSALVFPKIRNLNLMKPFASFFQRQVRKTALALKFSQSSQCGRVADNRRP